MVCCFWVVTLGRSQLHMRGDAMPQLPGPERPFHWSLFTAGLFFFPGAFLPLFGGQPAMSKVRVSLYTDFQHEPPAIVSHAIQDELDLIMTPIGLSFDWRSLAHVKEKEVSISLVVIHFKGTCDAVDLTLYPAYQFIAGRTFLAGGEIIPFSDIYCNAIRASLASALASLSPKTRDMVFGRAVGRVIAHELYHIYANTKRHGGKGLSEPRFSAHELMAGEFRFQKKDSERLRARVLPLLVQTHGFPGNTPANPAEGTLPSAQTSEAVGTR